MIDTHCHLTDERLGQQLDGVLHRAAAAGVHGMITISTGIADAKACIDVSRGRPNVRCTVGVHPNYVAQTNLDEIPQMGVLLDEKEVVAVGEIGLDYHYGLEDRDRQHQAFEMQLQMALDAHKPVVIHCREATDDCLAVLRRFLGIRAVFHCFTGTPAEAERILAAGFWLGFTGPITFKKSDELRAAVKATPLDRMLVETDAPYLTPEPMRKQKINEPALVIHVAAMAAQIKGVELAEFDHITSRNVAEFFGFSPPVLMQ